MTCERSRLEPSHQLGFTAGRSNNRKVRRVRKGKYMGCHGPVEGEGMSCSSRKLIDPYLTGYCNVRC
jgi:hypothetical protein